MGHERPVEPFSDLHVEGDHVRAVLLHDPSVEGLDMALYLDGSRSMDDEYAERVVERGGGLLWSLFGWGEKPERVTLPNQVEGHARKMLQYLATKDRNGLLRTAYWTCGARGSQIEVLGELGGASAAEARFTGPKDPGSTTRLTPALKDYVSYIRAQAAKGAKRGCAVIITDGQIHDQDDVMAFSSEVAREIVRGTLPRLNFVLVGVGDQIDEEQLERIAHEEYRGVGHLWCHRIAAEIKEIPELVAVLVDETMTVAAGGTVTDKHGNVLKTYEGRLPAVLEFEIPEGLDAFVLHVNGQKFVQPLPEEDHHDEEDEDEDHH